MIRISRTLESTNQGVLINVKQVQLLLFTLKGYGINAKILRMLMIL